MLETAVKNPAIPTITNEPGFITMPGIAMWNILPITPPIAPPITMEGPKTPPLPPEPMENDVVIIFPKARHKRKGMVNSLKIAFCAKPYPKARV